MKVATPSYTSFVRDDDGTVRFVFVAGRTCLDFVNTGGLTADRTIWERLNQPADITDWFAYAPVALPVVQVTSAELHAAHALREALWQSVVAIQQQHVLPLDAMTVINHSAAVPDVPPQFDLERGTHTWHTPTTGTAALSLLARDAIDLFTSDAVARIRKCENPQCMLIFVDMSRPGTRRWCAMERCGNRVKTARYRQRHT